MRTQPHLCDARLCMALCAATMCNPAWQKKKQRTTSPSTCRCQQYWTRTRERLRSWLAAEHGDDGWHSSATHACLIGCCFPAKGLQPGLPRSTLLSWTRHAGSSATGWGTDSGSRGASAPAGAICSAQGSGTSASSTFRPCPSPPSALLAGHGQGSERAERRHGCVCLGAMIHPTATLRCRA